MQKILFGLTLCATTLLHTQTYQRNVHTPGTQVIVNPGEHFHITENISLPNAVALDIKEGGQVHQSKADVYATSVTGYGELNLGHIEGGSGDFYVHTREDCAFSGTLTGGRESNSLIKSGPASFALVSDSPQFTGSTTVREGELVLHSSQALGSPNSAPVHVEQNGTLSLMAEDFRFRNNLMLEGQLKTFGNSCTLENHIAVEGNATIYVHEGTLDHFSSVTGSGNLTKVGNGRLAYFGDDQNTLSGMTYVREGSLALGKLKSTAISGALVIGARGELSFEGPRQLGDQAKVYLDGGKIDFKNHDQPIPHLFYGGGELINGQLTLNHLTVQAPEFSTPASVKGSITSDCKTTISSNIDLGNQTCEIHTPHTLRFTGQFENGGVNKYGNQTLVIGTDQHYEGPTTVSQGTLLLNADLTHSNVNIGAAGIFIGNATIHKNVSNSGRLRPEGLKILGDFVQDTSGILSSSVAHAPLKVSSNVSVAGRVEVDMTSSRPNECHLLIDAREGEGLNSTAAVTARGIPTGLKPRLATSPHTLCVIAASDDKPHTIIEKASSGAEIIENGHTHLLDSANLTISQPKSAFYLHTLKDSQLNVEAPTELLGLYGSGHIELSSDLILSGHTDFSGTIVANDNSRFITHGRHAHLSGELDLCGNVRTFDIPKGKLHISGHLINGGIDKRGEGDLFISGHHNLSQPTTLCAGTTHLSGSLGPADVTVFNGARLTGSGSSGSLTNNGTLHPQGLTVSGQFNQTPSGQLIIDIKNAKEHDQLVVANGTAQLGGQLTIRLDNDHRCMQDDKIVLIDTKNGLGFQHDFHSVTLPVVPFGLTPVLICDPDALFIHFQVCPAFTLSAYPALGNFQMNQTHTRSYVLTEKLTTRRKQMGPKATLSPVTPPSATTYQPTTFAKPIVASTLPTTFASQVTPNAQEIAPSPVVHTSPVFTENSSNQVQLYIEGIGGLGDVDDRSTQPGFDFYSSGFIVGADIEKTATIVGLQFGNQWLWGDMNKSWGDFEIYSVFANAYLTTTFTPSCKFYVDIIAGGGHSWYEINRKTILGTAEGDTSGWDAHALCGAGYMFDFNQSRLTPFANLEYVHLTISPYTETKQEVDLLTISRQNADSLRSNLGLNYLYAWERVITQLSASWEYEFMDPDLTITGSQSTFGISNPPKVLGTGRNFLQLNARLNAELHKHLQMYLDYNFEYASDYINHFFQLGLSVPFGP